MATALAQQFGILSAIDCGQDLWIAAGCGVVVGLLLAVLIGALYIHIDNRKKS